MTNQILFEKGGLAGGWMDEKRNQPAAAHQGLNATNKKDGVWRFSIMILKILRSDGGAKVKVVKHFRESCKKNL